MPAPTDKGNKAKGNPPNETHADRPDDAGKPNPPAAAPLPVTTGDAANNPPGPADATTGVRGTMTGSVPPGRYAPELASGAEPPEQAGRHSGQPAGPGVPPAAGGPLSGRPFDAGGIPVPSRAHAGGAGSGASPQRHAESVGGGPRVKFGRPSVLPADAADDDDHDPTITLGSLAAGVRDVTAALKSHDYWTALRWAGMLAAHVADAATTINLGGATTGPRVGATRAEAEGYAAEWGDLDAACAEYDRVKPASVAMAPNAKHLDWHRSGGAASGSAPPMGSGPVVGFDPTDIMRILEIVQTVVDLIGKFRRK